MMKRSIIGVLLVAAFAPRAHADHHGMAMSAEPESSSDFAASVALVAANFDTMNYVGDYEGIVSSLQWKHGPFMVAATAPLYRLFENGASFFGLGDVSLAGHATIASTDTAHLGAMLMVSAPTGADDTGLGMGHAMVMPALYGAWSLPGIALAGSFGYSRALAEIPKDHDHGVWPLVDPMNMSELTWSASGDHSLTSELRVGGRFSGGIPVGGVIGHTRLIGALRVAYGHGRVETAAEIQAGIVGDPFTLRGVVETALRF
jgi:hypothetical protein